MHIKSLIIAGLATATLGVASFSEPADAVQLQYDQHPDLVFKMPHPTGPLPGAPMSGHCGNNLGSGAAKSVVVAVLNKGNSDAGAYQVRVVFLDAYDYAKTVEKAYPPIAPGPSAAIASFPIPKSAWKNGMARFEIMLDANGQVDEGGKAGERNNVKTAFCVQPAA